MRGAILATAARCHWKHNRTGRAIPEPANDSQQAAPNSACHLTAAAASPHLDVRGGGLFRETQ